MSKKLENKILKQKNGTLSDLLRENFASRCPGG